MRYVFCDDLEEGESELRLRWLLVVVFLPVLGVVCGFQAAWKAMVMCVVSFPSRKFLVGDTRELQVVFLAGMKDS